MYQGSGDVESAVHSALEALDLHTLSTAELKKLLNDDDQLSERVNDLTAVKSLRDRRNHQLASNRSLAEHNVAQQPRLLELKTLLRQLLADTEQLENELRQKRDQLSVTDQPLDTTLALLQTASAQAEEESENLVQSVLGGEMSVDNFLELYLPKRCIAISRRIKVDKLKDLLRSPAAGYRPPPAPPAAVPAGAPYSPPAPAPYPPAGPSGPYPAPYPPAGPSGHYPAPYPPAGPSGPYPCAALPYPPYMPQPRY